MTEKPSPHDPDKIHQMSAEEFLTYCRATFTKTDTGFHVTGNLECEHMGMVQLPDLSMVTVEQTFYCRFNELRSFKGCPAVIGNCIYSFKNPIETLAWLPEKFGSLLCDFETLINEEFNCDGLPPVPLAARSSHPQPVWIEVKGTDLEPYRNRKRSLDEAAHHKKNLEVLSKTPAPRLKFKR